MSVFSSAVIKQVLAALLANSTLVALVTGIHDHTPQENAYPFVNIGELVETEENTDDAQKAVVASLTIHTYSQEWGRKQTHEIQKEITNTLHRAALAQTGFNFISIDHMQSQSFTDSDGVTRHGVIEFNILISEV